MFNFLGDGIDGVYKTLWLLIGLQLVMSGGIGFIFRIISKPLNIGFENKKLKEMDKKLSDLQLLKLYHGINVSTIEDAELAALAISRKKLKPQKIWLMIFCPAIGLSKHGKFELFIMGILLSYCLYNAYSFGSDINKYRQDYVYLSDKSGSVFMSEIYVRDLKNGENYNKAECKELPKDSRSIIKMACRYLTTDDHDLRKELLLAIKQSNESQKITIISCVFFLSLSLLLIYAYAAYWDVNNQFYKFKTAELSYRKAKKYKEAFKEST